jgi:hypothetical protein
MAAMAAAISPVPPPMPAGISAVAVHSFAVAYGLHGTARPGAIIDDIGRRG